MIDYGIIIKTCCLQYYPEDCCFLSPIILYLHGVAKLIRFFKIEMANGRGTG